MRSALYQLSPDRRRASARDRAASFLMAAAIAVLVLIGLITLAPFVPRVTPAPDKPNTFSLAPPPPMTIGQKAVPHRAHHHQAAGGSSSPAPPRPPAAIKPPAPTTLSLPGVMSLSLASSDISKIAAPAGDESAGSGNSSGSGSGSTYGPGEGPGGAALYNADWYRRPTDAELGTYLPKNAPTEGWGLVACQTIADNHVDNCRQLGESPLGSGFSRAVRQAAWQFLIRPPRIGGRPLIGAWVRIRIVYRQGGASAAGG